jgi:amidase
MSNRPSEAVMPRSDAHFWSIETISESIKRREVSPVEVTQAMLDRIERLDPAYHAYITVMTGQALVRARRAEDEIGRGLWRGPLHGVPLAVKDLCFTDDAPTSAGMSIHSTWVPPHNATVVDRLYEAGAIILGKLTLTEGAYTNNNPTFPYPVNPWGPAHWAGTSSSGSGVATALGLCYGSLGSDTGGSIRFPSACNNVTGIKPTWGRVSRYGIHTLSHTLDHIGPMARSAADAAAILGAIAGADEHDATSRTEAVPDYLAATRRGISGLRIGVDERFISSGTHPEVVDAVAAALAVLQNLGAKARPVTFPSATDTVRGWIDICGAETAQVHAATYPSRAAEYEAGMAGLIEHGRRVSGAVVAQAWLHRLEFSGRLAAAFADVDLLLVPTMPGPIPLITDLTAFGADDQVLLDLIRYTAPFDLSGHPTIVLPCGVSGSGMPLSLQLVGRHLAEDMLCAAGHAYQQRTDWHLRRPESAA